MHRPYRPTPLKLDTQLAPMQRSYPEEQLSKVEQESEIIQHMMRVPSRNANNTPHRHRTQHKHRMVAREPSQQNVRDSSLPGIFVALNEDSCPPRSKNLFGPSGILDRPLTLVETQELHAKEKTGLKKWTEKIKGAAGELKADFKNVADEIKDVAGELASGRPVQTRRHDRHASMDGYSSAHLTTSISGPNIRFTHSSDESHPSSTDTSGFPLLDSPSEPPTPPKRPLPKISLPPPIQARLFSELELLLTKTINDYLLGEKMMGRMSEESLEKVVKSWIAKGRPLPNELYFDLATQLELFHANLKAFRFFGQHQGSYLHIQSMLNGWSALAKRLNRRTLSTPDSDIKKYLVDIDHILNLLGVDHKVWTSFGYWRDATLQALAVKDQEEKGHGAKAWGVPMAFLPPHGGSEEAFDDQNIVETGLRLLGHVDG